MPSGCPALTFLPPADFFTPFRFFGERALVSALAPRPAIVARMLEMVAPNPARATVPPESVPKLLTNSLPTFAVMLP